MRRCAEWDGVPVPAKPIVARPQRKGRNYRFTVFGEPVVETSLKNVLKRVIDALQARDSGFLLRLSQHRTQRGRRIVARSPHEVYPGRPQLVEQGMAEEIKRNWYLDTNVSKDGTIRYVMVMCDIAGVEFGTDVKFDF